MIIRENIVQRLTDSLETAIALTGDVVLVEVIGGEINVFQSKILRVTIAVSACRSLLRDCFLSIIHTVRVIIVTVWVRCLKSTRPCYSRRKFKYNKRCYFSDRLGKCKQKKIRWLICILLPLQITTDLT